MPVYGNILDGPQLLDLLNTGSSRQLRDSGSYTVLDWETGDLFYDGTLVAQWKYGDLFDSSGMWSLDWWERLLVDTSSNRSIDWNNRSLLDNSGLSVMDWGYRQLRDSAGNKRIIDLQGLLDDSMDTDAIKKGLDEDLSARTGARDREKDASTNRIAQERDAALKMLEQEHEQNMGKIGQASIDAENQLDADAKKKTDAAQAELDAARKEWQDAIGEARKKREMKDAEGPKRLEAPPALSDYLEGLGPTIEQAQKKTIGVAGTFNAMEARGLGAGGVTDRIANATEATAKNTQKLADKVRDGGLAFE